MQMESASQGKANARIRWVRAFFVSVLLLLALGACKRNETVQLPEPSGEPIKAQQQEVKGWAEKKPGYGWEFSSMLTTADSLLQSYRLRLALEPAALLEPGYQLSPAAIARCRAAEQHLLAGGIATDTADQLHERGVRFHETLVEGSGNAFFIDTIRRVNRVRRLLSYRSMQERSRYKEHCEQHLHLLELLERGRNQEAAQAMHAHLSSTLRNLKKISNILTPENPSP